MIFADSLLNLLGLADIRSNCPSLTALNIEKIYEIENVSSLWEILSRMKKTASVSNSCISDRGIAQRSYVFSLARINLSAIDIEYDSLSDYDIIE